MTTKPTTADGYPPELAEEARRILPVQVFLARTRGPGR